MNRSKTYINQDDEDMTCLCNYNLSPIIIDYDDLILLCTICGHTESFPEYAVNASEDIIKEHYAHPLKDLVGAEKSVRQEREDQELHVINAFA